ncbi:SRPBCC domain-containing protein [Kribbella qitaiheensis]|uniref:SRPBCC domain-containing protein n=1 Tax=Kribbella qitaiheensis TaxID=1544730 RepID=A0A7G6X7U9_9ACTN|nr:SRPBCC domain-containing protein [Kribbella qitaiheensis]QNE22314.1 SRPBCC domain-containing protein [Kribbella qitaiheensis]
MTTTSTQPTKQPKAAKKMSPVRRRLLTALATFVVLLAGYCVFSIAHPTVLRSQLEVDATPDQVWKVLTDREAYPSWNPFIVSSTGDLEAGGTITNVLRDTTGQETTFTPELLKVDPGRELRWIGKVGFGGIFDGEHSFRIEPLPGGRARLIQQETFRGVAVPVMAGWLSSKIKPQFDAMNQALATRAAAAAQH